MSVSNITEIALPDRLRCFYNGDGLYVAVLPSHACYAVPLSPPLSRRTEKSLTFQLESEVPLDAESMSVYVPQHRQLALVVDAVNVANSLKSEQLLSGMTCLAVVPEIVLACEHFQKTHGDQQSVLFAKSMAGDMVRIDDGQIRSWEWGGEFDSTAIYEDVYIVELDRAASELDSKHAIAPPADENWSEEPWLRAAVGEILNGSRRPGVSFDSGALSFVDALAPARKMQQYFAAAAILLLLACMSALLWRAAGYRGESSRLAQEQETVYRRLFPDQTVPIGMKTRVESELRRLSATRDISQVPKLGDALPVMHAFWKSLPDSSVRFNFSLLHFTPASIESAEGMAKGYSELEVLRTRLNSHGFSVPPISSTLTASGATLRWEKIGWSPPDVKPKNK